MPVPCTSTAMIIPPASRNAQEVETVESVEGQMSKVSALPSAGAGRAVITASAVIRRRISWCPELLGQFQTLPLIV